MACNVYNDAMALRGLLETAQSFFDNIYIIHSGPGGAYSTDGTIELCQQFGVQPVFADINAGFGEIRSRLLHECGEAWCMIMDADERFHANVPVLECHGEGVWNPSLGFDNPLPDLRVVRRDDVVQQGRRLRDLIQRADLMAIRTRRRHWFDFSFKKPTQNWFKRHDHQLRIVRNIPEISYRADTRMHERIRDSRTGEDPHYYAGDDISGPFHDHYHCFFRKARVGHKESNEKEYSKLVEGGQMAAWEAR